MSQKTKITIGVITVLAIVTTVTITFSMKGDQLTGKFSVNNPVTRAELAKMVATAMVPEYVNLDWKQFKNCANDTIGHPNEGYICYLVQKDIMGTFVSSKIFKPEAPVLRSEAAKVFTLAYYSLKGDGKMQYMSYYKDVLENDWFTSWVEAAASLGILDIKPGVGAKFYPNQYLTYGRAEFWTKNFKTALSK